MAFYTEIDSYTPAGKRRRIAKKILELRHLFDNGKSLPGDSDYISPIPARTLNDNLIIASWNIREFDSPSFGIRSEAMHYIAEIISRFDLIAIQEVRKDIEVLRRLKRLLGGSWDYLVTDETSGAKGNSERLAFLFDRRKVRFTGLAGEVVLPDNALQFARTPFLIGFQAGWFKFTMCTVHILYGKQKAVDPDRLREITEIAKHFQARMLAYRGDVKKGTLTRSEYENVILLGDFNIFSVRDETYRALTNAGFDVSPGLFGRKTNTGKSHRAFDQIAYMHDAKNVQATGAAGVFDYYDVVYKDDEQAAYEEDMRQLIRTLNKSRSSRRRLKEYDARNDAQKRTYYRTYWRTHQMSDHLPIWLELKTNFSAEYLERRAFPND